jgi:N-acetylglucosaminyldiphosphoundecaprenol N-acetyl-beta-D-mannosaminyltransferase
MLRQLGAPEQRRLNGPDLMWRYLALEAPKGGKVYLYGATETTLDRLRARLGREFPGLQVVGAESPPFRPCTPTEDAAQVDRINSSGAHVVFVGLGCPKQEFWMAQHRGRINAVMIGVGAAFDFHAGVQARAPEWMQHHGLEWAYRLVREPRRLWRRYLLTNIPFLFMGGGQWMSSRFNGARPAKRQTVPAAALYAEEPDEGSSGVGQERVGAQTGDSTSPA